MTTFTAKERDAINQAFDAIRDRLETTDWNMPVAWRNALKSERRECSNITAAKAMMVENFTDGIRKPEGAAELFRIRSGCREAHMIGAYLWMRANAKGQKFIQAVLLPLCDKAIEAKQAAFHRRADQVTNPDECKP